ncbi:MAG: heparinase II/III-family protein [Gemmatimonadota bacterium]|nr:heparinase II/III-family protein [Gemmatimonadota bacterium]
MDNNLVRDDRVKIIGAVAPDLACLSDGDVETAVNWSSVSGECGFDVKFDGPVLCRVVVLRWKAMPADYDVAVRGSRTWEVQDSIRDNVILGPRVKLHLLDDVRTDGLRVRFTRAVSEDLHGRDADPGGVVALYGMEAYAADRLPAYIRLFLDRDTPRLAAMQDDLSGRSHVTPDPSLLDVEVPTWAPIPKRLYNGQETGRAVNEKDSARRTMLQACAGAFALTGDRRHALKARDVLLANLDHYDRYQSFRFTGIAWQAVTFQDPAYNLREMMASYDMLVASPHLEFRDRMRFLFFLLDLGEFQYLAIRDRFEARENWASCSLAEMVFLAYYLADFPEVGRWLKLADERYGSCFEPFLDDGYWWECSPSHSVYMIRGMCRYALGRHLIGDAVWSKAYNGKSLEDVLEALCKTMTPFGEVPSINDSNGNDGHLLTDYPELRVPLYLIGRGDLLRMAGDSGIAPSMPGVVLGPVPQKDPTYTSVVLPDAGLAVMRDGWSKDDAYLIFDFGPHGGGHGHPDKLSFVMFANGHHWIPDASNSPHYSIFPEQYTWHKQTISHNTVLANNTSQNECTGQLIFWHTDDDVDMVCAYHNEGYEGLVHRRTIVHPRRGYFLIHDELRAEADGFDLDWLLHVYGEVESQAAGSVCFRSDSGSQRLLWCSGEIGTTPLPTHRGLCGGFRKQEWTGSGYPPKGGPGWVYIPYFRLPGRIERGGGRAGFFSVLYPFTEDVPDVAVERVDDGRGRASGIRIAHNGVEDVYAGAVSDYDAARDGDFRCGGLAGRCKAVFERRDGAELIYRKECN